MGCEACPLIKENAVTRLKQSLPKLEIKWGDDDASDDSDASDASDDADDSNDDADSDGSEGSDDEIY